MKEFYLGFSTAGRKSFRDVKSLPAPQALAVKRGDCDQHYDELETRPPKAREGALMAALPAHIAHAQGERARLRAAS